MVIPPSDPLSYCQPSPFWWPGFRDLTDFHLLHSGFVKYMAAAGLHQSVLTLQKPGFA